ncbi:MAG: diguanylate cyclase [Chloroflexi bacterium]|nr:diguanylate cyclase [Chloroflexota bacterium]
MESRTYDLQALVDKFLEPVILLAPDYRIAAVNTAFRQTGGEEAENAVGDYCYRVLHNMDEPCFQRGVQCVVKHAWETGESGCATHLTPTEKGDRYLEVSAVPVADTDGHQSLVMHVSRDVTERILTESYLRERNRELAALNAVITSVSLAVDLQATLNNALEKVLELADMEAGGIRLFDSKTGELVGIAYKGLPEELIKVQKRAGKGSGSVNQLGLSEKVTFLQTLLARLRVSIFEGIVGQAVQSGRPITVRNVGEHPELAELLVKGVNVRSLIVLPMKAEGETVGVLALATTDIRTVTERDLEFLSSVANAAGIAIANAKLHEQVRHLASTDGLTGLYNHRYCYERLDEGIDHATRYGETLSLLFIDVNGLKAVNDTFGHLAGDLVLRELARVVKNCVRRTDIACRYGGDEFCVILPHTSCEQAGLLGRRLLRAIGANPFIDDTGNVIRVSASLGATSLSVPCTPEELVKRADQAAYKAKQLKIGIVCEGIEERPMSA